MLPRSQVLTHTCSLALGLIIGSLATAVLRPAAPTNAKTASKAENSGTEVALPAAQAVAKAAPKAEKPAIEMAPPAAPAVATAVPKAEAPKPIALFPAPPTDGAGPEAQADKKPAPEAAKEKPADVLAKQGLKRSGPVYILQADEDLKQKIVEYWLSYNNELGPIDRELSRLQTELKAQQIHLDELEQSRMKLQFLQAQAAMNPNGPQPPRNPSPFGQPPGNNGPLDPNEGEMKQKGGEQEPKKENPQGKGVDAKGIPMAPAQLGDQIEKLETNITQAIRQIYKTDFSYENYYFYADRALTSLNSKKVLLNMEHENLMKKYDELGKDPVVTTALEELSKGPGPRVALGPEEDYRGNLKKMDERLLIRKGLFPARTKGRRGPVEAGGAQGLEERTKLSDHAFQEAVKKQKGERTGAISRQSRLAQWSKEEADLDRQIAKAPTAGEKLGLEQKKKNAKDGIEKVLQQENQAEETRKKLSQEVAVKRKAFVENVAALERAVEDPAAQQAIKAQPPAFIKKLKAYLVSAKKRIRTEQIKLDPDKAMIWVEVILNENKAPTKIVLDPGVDEIRISEAFAAAQEIRPLDTDPRINVALGNGQILSATRIKLKAVQMGSFKVNDVECLVFSKEFDGNPQLGASFLDHFCFEADAREARLTLTKVD